MINKITLILLFCVQGFVLLAQEKAALPCYPISFLDFFGKNDTTKVEAWPLDEILNLREEISSKAEMPKFLIPLILTQIQAHHPQCNEEADTIALHHLIETYKEISSSTDLDDMTNKSILSQIDLIRADFYSLTENDKHVAEMLFTLDDGPFFGKSVHEGVLLEAPIHNIDLPFGKLLIFQNQSCTYVQCITPEHKILWQKTIVASQEKSCLTDLHIPKNKDIIKKSTLTTTVNLYFAGERLTLYMRNNGQFMFYFYSW